MQQNKEEETKKETLKHCSNFVHLTEMEMEERDTETQ